MSTYFRDNGDVQYTLKVNSIITNSYLWMSIALAITGVVAFVTSTNTMLLKLIFGNPFVPIVLMVAQLGIVFAISGFIDKLSAATATALLFIYAMTLGLSLSAIFLVYSIGSIATTFITTSLLFGFMAILGFVTKKDLTSFGNVMIGLLFGIMIASLINFFLHSSFMEYVISLVGVVIFMGLTMYDSQKLKEIAMENMYADEQSKTKIVVVCALNLYLDFINLFLFLLKLFARRD